MTEDNVPSGAWDDALRGLVDDAFGRAPASPGSQPTPGEAAAPSAEDLLAERTGDLQRLQAEYSNYKKRVDRDRAVARQSGIEAVLGDLLPVLDGIEAARGHGELDAGTKLLADGLAKVASKYGLEPFGAEGEPFDPHVHEALMRTDKPGYAVTSVAQVFQAGYKLNDRVLRPARVAVADADPTLESEPEATPGREATSTPDQASASEQTIGREQTSEESTSEGSPSGGSTSGGSTSGGSTSGGSTSGGSTSGGSTSGGPTSGGSTSASEPTPGEPGDSASTPGSPPSPKPPQPPRGPGARTAHQPPAD